MVGVGLRSALLRLLRFASLRHSASIHPKRKVFESNFESSQIPPSPGEVVGINLGGRQTLASARVDTSYTRTHTSTDTHTHTRRAWRRTHPQYRYGSPSFSLWSFVLVICVSLLTANIRILIGFPSSTPHACVCAHACALLGARLRVWLCMHVCTCASMPRTSSLLC